MGRRDTLTWPHPPHTLQLKVTCHRFHPFPSPLAYSLSHPLPLGPFTPPPHLQSVSLSAPQTSATPSSITSQTSCTYRHSSLVTAPCQTFPLPLSARLTPQWEPSVPLLHLPPFFNHRSNDLCNKCKYAPSTEHGLEAQPHPSEADDTDGEMHMNANLVRSSLFNYSTTVNYSWDERAEQITLNTVTIKQDVLWCIVLKGGVIGW